MTLQVFVGMDARQPLAFTVCASSIYRHAKTPVSVQPIGPDWIPGFTRNGLTQFTFRRYLVPHICSFKGRAIFLDGDTIVRADINELADEADPLCSVSVAQHVAKFERPSVMVFMNAMCLKLTQEYVDDPMSKPQSLEWANGIGTIPPEWNHCVLYEPHRENAKLIHWTCGIPCWPETKKSPHAEAWTEEFSHAIGTVSWQELMGRSVHVDKIRALNGSPALRA